MNVKLLRRIQKHILAEPRRYDQGTYGEKVSGDQAPACGTKACIAGWAYIIGKGLDPRNVTARELWNDAGVYAEQEMGLTPQQADRLFSDSQRQDYGADGVDEGWPKKFWRRYQNAIKATTKARIACERIDHFIKTKGAE